MHHDPAVEAELHVEFIGISGWTGVVDEIDITLGLTGIMGVGFCSEEIIFRQRQQALRDITLEVSQVRRVSCSASAQNKSACSCGRVYVSQRVVWCLQGQFSTIMVSSARTSTKEFAQSLGGSDIVRAAHPRRLLYRNPVCHAAPHLLVRYRKINELYRIGLHGFMSPRTFSIRGAKGSAPFCRPDAPAGLIRFRSEGTPCPGRERP